MEKIVFFFVFLGVCLVFLGGFVWFFRGLYGVVCIRYYNRFFIFGKGSLLF